MNDLAVQVIESLIVKSMTCATAESCTGGMVAAALVSVPGASQTFLAGYVTYANDAKVRDLSVSETLLEAHGAVSGEVACSMADGARTRTGADIAVSVTGIAGPDGGTSGKPVGLVYIGISTAQGTHATRHLFPGDRATIRELATRNALFSLLNARK